MGRTVPRLLQKAFALKKPLGDQLNRKLMRNFRLYMLVGGMPQSLSGGWAELYLVKDD